MATFSLLRLSRTLLPDWLYARVRDGSRDSIYALSELFDAQGRRRRLDAAEYFKNTCVALVGPSPSIIGMRQGPHIDKYDLTARLNSALPLDPTNFIDIGSRCEVLFSSLFTNRRSGIDPGVPIDPDSWVDQGVEQSICAYPRWKDAFHRDVGEYVKNHPNTLPFAWATRTQYHHQCKRLGGARPTTGYAAINYLLDQPIKEIFVTGFTFMRDGYQKQYRDITVEQSQKVVKTIGVHHPERELQDLRRLVLKDPRIKVDTVLQQIFDAEPAL